MIRLVDCERCALLTRQTAGGEKGEGRKLQMRLVGRLVI